MNLAVDFRMINESGIGRYLDVISNSMNVSLGLHQEKTLGMGNASKKISMLSGIYDPRQFIEIPYLLRTSGPIDVYWTPHYNLPPFGMSKFKTVATIHDILHISKHSNLAAPSKQYAKFMLKSALAADEVITVSEFSKSQILKTFGDKYSDKIHVIHNGVDFDKFNRKSDDLSYVLDLGIKPPFILAVGNIKPHKNLTVLLDAYLNSELLQETFQLVLVGRKDGFITGQKFANKFDRLIKSRKILFTGYVQDNILPSVYSMAEVLVFPSTYEGFGLPALEAQAAKTLVLLSDIPVFKEVCGSSAFYFQKFDSKDLEEQLIIIKSISEEERSKMIEKGILNAKRYTWQKSIELHHSVFSNI